MVGQQRSKVVVIGAGVSGLTAVKACLEEGLDVVCYEKTDNLGGVWRYREEVLDGVASVMKSTIINTSKEVTAFSDFPPPIDFPVFMHNGTLVRYLEMYAEKNCLLERIRFGHEIVKIAQSDHFERNGEWIVSVRKQKSTSLELSTASAVMVCTGHHSYPLRSTFPGLENFKGKIVHTHSYKTWDGFEDKNILVIGFGNSGGDVAVELSHVAKKVYLSTRRGAWVLPRSGDCGMPLDIQYGRRYLVNLLNSLPQWIRDIYVESKINARVDHSLFCLKPLHSFYAQHPTINDSLPGRLLSGAIILKGDVAGFTQDGVIFKEESNLTHPIDAILLATGYEIRFPFLDEKVMNVKNNQTTLYKHVFPSNLSHPTLAFIGLVQPIGALPPIAELQSRWVVSVFQSKSVLPSRDVMREDINKAQRLMKKRYVTSVRHTIQVDSIAYMDDIAAMLGVRPIWWQLLLLDPRLFWAFIFGPAVPYHYRLRGPHAWPGARDTIFGVQFRILASLHSRCFVRSDPEGETWRSILWAVLFAGLGLLGFYFIIFMGS